MRFSLLVAVTVLFICAAVSMGCEESGGPPYKVKNVNIAENYITEDYDVYQVVAFPVSANNPAKGKYITRQMVEELLDYYEEKYKDQERVKVLVFRDPASAMQGVSDFAFAELEMLNGEVIMRMITVD